MLIGANDTHRDNIEFDVFDALNPLQNAILLKEK